MPKEFFEDAGVSEWFVKLDPKKLLEHNEFTANNMIWFQTEGKAILEGTAPATFDLWMELLKRSYFFVRDFPDARTAKELFRLVIDRGIDGFIQFAADIDKEQRIEWFRSLIFRLEPGALLGLQGEKDHDCNARNMLDRLVLVTQPLRNEAMLGRISECRHPHDPLAQKLFIDHHKNWQD